MSNSDGTSFAEKGSVVNNGPANANELGLGGTGEPKETENEFKNLYENAEKKIGELGKEVGDWRSFFDGISPLLEKLDKSPILVNAIIDGKVDENLAKAAVDGKISVEDAKIITKAHTEVKKDLGAKDYSNASKEEITQLVEERVAAIKKELEDKMTENDKLKSFEDSVYDFIEKTPDFGKYSAKVEEWLENHPDVADISVAYYAVKGELTEKEALEKAEEDRVNFEKEFALNSGGGSSRVSGVRGDSKLVDVLIGEKSNPNSF